MWVADEWYSHRLKYRWRCFCGFQQRSEGCRIYRFSWYFFLSWNPRRNVDFCKITLCMRVERKTCLLFIFHYSWLTAHKQTCSILPCYKSYCVQKVSLRVYYFLFTFTLLNFVAACRCVFKFCTEDDHWLLNHWILLTCAYFINKLALLWLILWVQDLKNKQKFVLFVETERWPHKNEKVNRLINFKSFIHNSFSVKVSYVELSNYIIMDTVKNKKVLI